MTMPKKKSRTITINGRRFRWRSRTAENNPHVYGDDVRIAIEEIDKPGVITVVLSDVMTVDQGVLALVIRAILRNGVAFSPSSTVKMKFGAVQARGSDHGPRIT